MSYSAKLLGILILNLVAGIAFGQERPLGTWKVFMPYGSSVGVCNAGDKIYAAGPKSVFSYEKATGVIQTYDKSNGLSDVDVKLIGFDPANNYLVIAYNNGNIDLVHNGTDVYNISDIKAENTSSSVGINGVCFYQGNCYLSTDIGISVINLAKHEISNTYIIKSGGGQVKVYATAIDGTNIYAATEEGVKHAPLNSPNLLDFNSWKLYGAADSLPAKKAKYVATAGGKVYAVIAGTNADTLYTYNAARWSKLYTSPKEIFTSMDEVGGTIYFTIWNDNNTTAGKKGKIDAAGTIDIQPVQGHVRPVQWFDDKGTHWEADYWNGIFKNAQGNIANIKPDGPFSAAVFQMDVKDGVLYLAPGSTDGDSWGFGYMRDGFAIYKNNQWIIQNEYNNSQLKEWMDIIAVAAVPARGKTYFGSYYAGLIEYDNNTGAIKQYDKNSPDALLDSAQGDGKRTKVTAMTLDDQGNVWIATGQSINQLRAIRPDGTWRQFSVPYNIEVLKRVEVDRNGQVWSPLRRPGSGLLVFDYNGTMDDASDDKSRILTTGAGNGALPDALVHCTAEDNEGNMWVGTNQGIAVFYCGGSILTNGCDADLIKVERDGYIGYLFGTESVRALAVDAANRKWVGTTNGLWLISEDGKTELLKFTVDNSPLPTNQITDIDIDAESGEVFIGTTGGLVSYQGDAIATGSDCGSALVYPNPVKPDYTGPIAIKGLAENAYVKIADITGTLIYQGKANGTQMIWDGYGYNGVKAKSGVYTVYSSTDMGKEKCVSKILLTN